MIAHLKPAADGIGLRRKEFYSTIKSGMKAGRARPRIVPAGAADPRPTPAETEAPVRELPPRSIQDQQGERPAFVAGGDDGPPTSRDEIRRHVYCRDGRPVRVKVKRSVGYVNWYRVADRGRDGWQAGKPDGYLPCPYVSALDPFDRELVGDVLYWPEGEKDCDTLGTLALPAFSFGGTGDGLPVGCAEHVRGRHLVILADNDRAGREHASRKAELASKLAASIKIVEFTELPVAGDVSDYLKSHTVTDLETRVGETPYWSPQPTPPAGPSTGRKLVTCTLSEITPEKVEWLWPGRIAVGKLAMIAGEPGLGKSQLAIAVASAVTTGGRWPDSDSRAPFGNVIILSAEDGLADTIRPRFDAAGGDPARVTVIRSTIDSSGGRQSFNLGADLALLEDEIRRTPDTRLVMIDPVSSYLGTVDSHKNAEVRSVLEPLGDMAERHRVAVLAITHLSKGDGKAIHRFIGSIAFVAAARTAFAIVSDPEDAAGVRRLFLQVKNNIAPPQVGLAFRLHQREVAPGVIGSAIDWDHTVTITTTVDQALKGGAAADDCTAKDDAIELLRDILAAGPVDVLDIEAEARAAAMLSETRRLKESKPFRAAANELGVIRKRQGFGPGARVQWSLPEPSASDDSTETGGSR